LFVCVLCWLVVYLRGHLLICVFIYVLLFMHE